VPKRCTCGRTLFPQSLNAEHNQSPRVINVDKNAVITPAIDNVIADQTLTKTTELEESSTNNMVEQDHRFIKRLVARDGVSPSRRANLEGIRGDEHDPQGQIQESKKATF